MTEPPRPPGDGGTPGGAPDPTSPPPPTPSTPAASDEPTGGSQHETGPGAQPYEAPPGAQPYEAAPAPPGAQPYGVSPPPAYGTPPYQPGFAPYPPGGGYPPAAGPYQPGGTYYGAGGVPVGYATNDDKNWALLAHFGPLLLGLFAPLVAMLAKGNQSPTVRAHAVEALNFHITWAVATFVATILAVCTFGVLFFLPLGTWIVAIVFAIIGGTKASEGVLYRYPMSVRMVK